jgi:hypothetical protein
MAVLHQLALNILKKDPSKGSLRTKYYRLKADRLNSQVAESNVLQAEASSMGVD